MLSGIDNLTAIQNTKLIFKSLTLSLQNTPRTIYNINPLMHHSLVNLHIMNNSKIMEKLKELKKLYLMLMMTVTDLNYIYIFYYLVHLYRQQKSL